MGTKQLLTSSAILLTITLGTTAGSADAAEIAISCGAVGMEL